MKMTYNELVSLHKTGSIVVTSAGSVGTADRTANIREAGAMNPHFIEIRPLRAPAETVIELRCFPSFSDHYRVEAETRYDKVRKSKKTYDEFINRKARRIGRENNLFFVENDYDTIISSK